MARGGARTGAGRKKGSLTKRTREIAEKAMESGMTPLEVMLKAMNEHVVAERWDNAASVAKDAAPYVHPKLAAIEHSGSIGSEDLSGMSDADLEHVARTGNKPARDRHSIPPGEV